MGSKERSRGSSRGPEKENGGEVPSVRRKDVIALVCADLHLSHVVPIARSVEKNWYDVQDNYLDQLYSLAEKWRCPVLIAGDIFDRWNPPPELLNFTITRLPQQIYAVAGQHDLPFHNYKDIKKSGYWTLVEAGKIANLCTYTGTPEGLQIHGFPFGFEVKPVTSSIKYMLLSAKKVALIHSYIWTGNKCYPGASRKQEVSSWKKRLKGYDVAVFGDNHKGFIAQCEDCTISNCGTFMRRKMDEIKYRPSIGLLHSDGSVTRHYLDCSKDKFLDSKTERRYYHDMGCLEEFVKELESLGDSGVNFREEIERKMRDEGIEDSVRKIIWGALQEKYGSDLPC